MTKISPLVSKILGRNGSIVLKVKYEALNPYRPSKRKRSAWRYLQYLKKIMPDFSAQNQRFLGRNGVLVF